MNRIEWIPIQDSLGRVSFRKLSVGGGSAILSIRLTRQMPRGPPKAGAHDHVTFFFLMLN